MDTVEVLFGQTRSELLSLFCGNADEAFYVRELVHSLGMGSGSVQREIRKLAHLGLITRMKRGNRCFYQANKENPLFPEIQSLTAKASLQKLPTVMRTALRPLDSKIQTAFVYGSVAKKNARPDSDIDLMLVGDVTFEEIAPRLKRAATTLHREINPTIYSLNDFHTKMKDGNHFLNAVMRGDRLVLFEDSDEIKRLGS